ncbi:MAG: ethanolamine utilization protein EutN [Defluviitaleaceae bacterium]|nr:ethanolamine utilization protein EutN [Defluviitaleaceae bacterium]
MRIARVVGNVVSTVKDAGFVGYKLMIISYIDEPQKRDIAFDAADAGVGDIVLVVADGGASNIALGDSEIIADVTICGVVDNYTLGKTIYDCH